MNQSAALLENMTASDKHRLFAAIAREFVDSGNSTMIPVADDTSMIGYFVPIGTNAEIISPNEKSPYLEEIRERAGQSTNSLSIDEFLNRLDSDETE